MLTIGSTDSDCHLSFAGCHNFLCDGRLCKGLLFYNSGSKSGSVRKVTGGSDDITSCRRSLYETSPAWILLRFLVFIRVGSSAYFQSSFCGVQISICSAFAQDGILGWSSVIRSIICSIWSIIIVCGSLYILYSAALIIWVSFSLPRKEPSIPPTIPSSPSSSSESCPDT